MNNNLLRDDSGGSLSSNEERLSNTESPKRKIQEWNNLFTAPATAEPEFQAVAFLSSRPHQEWVQPRAHDEVSYEEQSHFIAEPSKGMGNLKLQEQEPFEQEILNIHKLVKPPPGWNISGVRVLPLPVYHRIEKFNVTFSKENIEVVLLSLQDNFRADSLTVQYQDGSATETTLARCLSMDGVKFVVQVWQFSETEYIIEIQRTGGDIMLFSQHRYAKRILSVVKRCSALPATDQPQFVDTSPADPLCVSPEAAQEEQRRIDALFKAHNVPAPTEQDALSSIEIAGENLASPFFDRVAMGLDIVMSMTDPSKSGWTMAFKTSKTVLLGDDNAPEIVKQMPDSIAYLAFSRRPLSTMDETDAEFAHYHAYSALTIVAQAVNLWDEDSTKVFVERVKKQDLKPIEVLLDGIQNAGIETHVAYLSAHILAAVCRAIPSVREKIRMQFRPVVEHAQDVGVCSHAALAQASKRLLQELSVSL